jgi:hypothetical protein
MKMSASEPKTVDLNDLREHLDKLVRDKEAETFLGSLMTTKGLFILLFSHRYNEEHALIVPGTDAPRILARVYETLAGSKKGTSP